MNDQTLEALTKLLTKRAMTAAEVAKATKCGKPTAYRRLRLLRERLGVRVAVEERKPSSGPKAMAYRVLRRVK